MTPVRGARWGATHRRRDSAPGPAADFALLQYCGEAGCSSAWRCALRSPWSSGRHLRRRLVTNTLNVTGLCSYPAGLSSDAAVVIGVRDEAVTVLVRVQVQVRVR